MTIFAGATTYFAMEVFENIETQKLFMTKFSERMLSGSFQQQNFDYRNVRPLLSLITLTAYVCTIVESWESLLILLKNYE